MSKFLFTEGNGVKEVLSREELQKLINASPDKKLIRIWAFNSNSWQSFDKFKSDKGVENPDSNVDPIILRPAKRFPYRAVSVFLVLVGALSFMYFTRSRWEGAAPVQIHALWPENVPRMDVDSLISEIEYQRKEKIGNSTRNNLRLRNTWPDRIGLLLKAVRETDHGATRFSSFEISLDNTTGFQIDNAVVSITAWKNGVATVADTVRFNAIDHSRPVSRSLTFSVEADSLSIDYSSIRARGFNFCYSAKTENNSGNYNDRWFCK